MKHKVVLCTISVWLSVGCDVGGPEPENFGLDGVQEDRQWSCEQLDTRITCTAALTLETTGLEAYACNPGDDHASCPTDELTLELTHELPEEVLTDFVETPWACWRTGGHQASCTKDLALLTEDPEEAAPEEPPPAPEDEQPDDEQPDDSAPDGDCQDCEEGEPPLPSDCDVHEWESWFCAMATHKFREHGVAIEFPCSIFDASGLFDAQETAEAASSSVEGAPSCHIPEWDMRETAWVSSLTRGCDLPTEITTWCQQAANYAALEGACNPTGNW